MVENLSTGGRSNATFFSPEQNANSHKWSYYFYYVCLFIKKRLQCVIALTNEALLYPNAYQ